MHWQGQPCPGQLLVQPGVTDTSTHLLTSQRQGHSYCLTYGHTEARGASCLGVMENRSRRVMAAKNLLLSAWEPDFEGSIPHFLLAFLVMFLHNLGEMAPKITLTDTTQRFHLITALSCDDGCKILRNCTYYLTVQSAV